VNANQHHQNQSMSSFRSQLRFDAIDSRAFLQRDLIFEALQKHHRS
jgi:hypothetical protein